MSLKLTPLKEARDVTFVPPETESPIKPVGLLADTLNKKHVEFHRSKKYSKDDYFLHVSDLIRSSKNKRFCPREHALSFVEGRTGNVQSVSPGMRMLHCIGHAVQEHITNDFILRSPHGAKVWGNWSCHCGHTQAYMMLKPDAGSCTKCGKPVDQYREITLVHRECRIIGHPDLLILWNNILHIYEIKTIDREAVNFETLAAPLGDHTLQATFYYWMARHMYENKELGYPVSEYIDYVYADRSNKKLFYGHPFKEFTKRASPGSRIKPMIENATLLRESLTKMRLPTRICGSARDPRAKICPMAVSCFNRTKDNIYV